ncbi:hypothetical protein [Lysinibacillus sp. LZ02]|uniref:hypothetical protein n=1 Tax=Lysinibacillus sp. LZ02 TaxID=3420668 RepID=UPI003D36D645
MLRPIDELEKESDELMKVAAEKFEVVKFYTEEIEKVIDVMTDYYSEYYLLNGPVLEELFSRLCTNLEIVEAYVTKVHDNLSEDILEEDE